MIRTLVPYERLYIFFKRILWLMCSRYKCEINFHAKNCVQNKILDSKNLKQQNHFYLGALILRMWIRNLLLFNDTACRIAVSMSKFCCNLCAFLSLCFNNRTSFDDIMFELLRNSLTILPKSSTSVKDQKL